MYINIGPAAYHITFIFSFQNVFAISRLSNRLYVRPIHIYVNHAYIGSRVRSIYVISMLSSESSIIHSMYIFDRVISIYILSHWSTHTFSFNQFTWSKAIMSLRRNGLLNVRKWNAIKEYEQQIKNEAHVI